MGKAKVFEIIKQPKRKEEILSMIGVKVKPKFVIKSYDQFVAPKVFPCETCGKEYSNRARLMIHIRTHTGEKPFKCNMCPKSFNENGNLKTHMRTHTGERPFKCTFEGCNKSYKVYGHLSDHIRSHLKIKPFKCELCNASYGRKTLLKAHILIHSGEKPFSCPYPNCKKRFREKGNMRTHFKKHFPTPGKGQTYRHMTIGHCTSSFSYAFFLNPSTTNDDRESWQYTAELESKKNEAFESNLNTTDHMHNSCYICDNEQEKQSYLDCLNVENLINEYKEDDFSHCTFNIDGEVNATILP